MLMLSMKFACPSPLLLPHTLMLSLSLHQINLKKKEKEREMEREKAEEKRGKGRREGRREGEGKNGRREGKINARGAFNNYIVS